MSAISPIGGLPIALPQEGVVRAPVAAPKLDSSIVPFGDVFQEAVSHANSKFVEASQAAQAFADGVREDIHGTMIAVKEADIELKLVSNVRSKLVDAFNDLWRMNV